MKTFAGTSHNGRYLDRKSEKSIPQVCGGALCFLCPAEVDSCQSQLGALRVGGALLVAGRRCPDGERRCRLRGKQVEREAYLVLSPACRPVEECTGRRTRRCFCPSRNGAAARVQLTRGETKCLFCSGEQTQKMNETGRSNGITAALERFCAASPGVYFAALDRVRRFLGQEAAKEYVARGQLCQGVNARQRGVNPKPPRRELSGPGLTVKGNSFTVSTHFERYSEL